MVDLLVAIANVLNPLFLLGFILRYWVFPPKKVVHPGFQRGQKVCFVRGKGSNARVEVGQIVSSHPLHLVKYSILGGPVFETICSSYLHSTSQEAWDSR